MPAESMELIFPLRGIDENWAFGRSPEGTCPDAQNVIPFDSLDSRARGGQRWGTSKYYAVQHNGAAALQRITSTALSIATPSSLTETFTQANGVLDDTKWYPLAYSALKFVISATQPRVASNKITRDETDPPGYDAAISKVASITVPNFELTAKVSITLTGLYSTNYVGFLIRTPTSFPEYTSYMIWAIVQLEWLSDWGTPGDYELDTSITSGTSGSTTIERVMTEGSNDYLDPEWWETERTLKLVVTGRILKLYIEDTLLQSVTVSQFPTQTGIGFVISTMIDYNGSVTLDDFTFTPIVESTRDHTLIAVSGSCLP